MSTGLLLAHSSHLMHARRAAAGRQARAETQSTRPCLDSRIHLQILLCKKKIPHYIKISAYVWSTKCR
jgi:hypothetical protein